MNLRELAERDDVPRMLCVLLREFHRLGWATGTGGGICGPAGDDALWVAPTGVHKELIEPEDLFRISIEDGTIEQAPEGLSPSECAPIFRAIASATGARSILHSHALSAVLVADGRTDDQVSIAGFEMIKGLGFANTQTVIIPVLHNTEREGQLTSSVEELLADPATHAVPAIMVADHGCYIWGRDVMETKKHAEVLHWLFEGVVARRQEGRS